jgi:hypothetical protein
LQPRRAARRYLRVCRYIASWLPEVRRGRACAKAASASNASCRAGSIYIWGGGGGPFAAHQPGHGKEFGCKAGPDQTRVYPAPESPQALGLVTQSLHLWCWCAYSGHLLLGAPTSSQTLGSSQGCLGSSQGCLGSSQGCLGSSQGCLGSYQGCLGSSQGCLALRSHL